MRQPACGDDHPRACEEDGDCAELCAPLALGCACEPQGPSGRCVALCEDNDDCPAGSPRCDEGRCR